MSVKKQHIDKEVLSMIKGEIRILERKILSLSVVSSQIESSFTSWCLTFSLHVVPWRIDGALKYLSFLNVSSNEFMPL